MRSMLKGLPGERKTARELLDDPWRQQQTYMYRAIHGVSQTALLKTLPTLMLANVRLSTALE